MSAFIVSRDHIWFLVQAHDTLDTWKSGGTDYAELAEAGQMLWDENIRSVEYRYSGSDDDHSDCQYGKHEIRSIPSPKVEPVAVLKACACFDYQACETDDYHETKAAKWIDRLRHLAITQLPGWDAAPWGIR